MNAFTLEMARAACGGRLCGKYEPDTTVKQVIIDSRLVQKGDMFVAYRGENTDGHRFISAALDRGAACALAEHVPEGEKRCVLLVENVQTALEDIAAAYRETLNIPFVGITGSVGKTTAKEMISAVLSQRMQVLKTDGNLNNQIGVPMTLSRIEREHEAAVVEMGISGFGEMTVLAKIVKPDIAVFTYIGHAHLEFLGDLEGVFRAKTEMLPYVKKGGTVIVNGDDALLRKLQCSQRLIRFGLSADCEVRAEKIAVREDGTMDCTICCQESSIHVHIPAYGRHMVYAALEGAAVGFAMGLSEQEIAAGIGAYQTVGRRGVLVETERIKLVDDCYNSNPDSLKCAIDSLVRLPGRHVCVLADMLEQGGNSAQIHYEAGCYAAQKKVDLLLAYGPMSEYTCRAMGDRGKHYESREALAQALPMQIQKGDAILVKASLGMHLESIAELLKTL